MSTDELPSPPRKSSWKRWTFALTTLLALALAALFLKALTNEPVSVKLVFSTNDNGQRKLIFEGTNGLPRRIAYVARIMRIGTSATQAIHLANVYHETAYGNIWEERTFRFSLDVPTNDVSWYMMWYFNDLDRTPSRLEMARLNCYVFLADHHMGILARPFAGRDNRHFIPSTDLKE